MYRKIIELNDKNSVLLKFQEADTAIDLHLKPMVVLAKTAAACKHAGLGFTNASYLRGISSLLSEGVDQYISIFLKALDFEIKDLDLDPELEALIENDAHREKLINAFSLMEHSRAFSHFCYFAHLYALENGPFTLDTFREYANTAAAIYRDASTIYGNPFQEMFKLVINTGAKSSSKKMPYPKINNVSEFDRFFRNELELNPR